MNTYTKVMEAINKIGDKLFCKLVYKSFENENNMQIKLFDENNVPVNAISLLEEYSEDKVNVLIATKSNLLLYTGTCICPDEDSNRPRIKTLELVDNDYKFNEGSVFANKKYEDIINTELITCLHSNKTILVKKLVSKSLEELDNQIEELRGLRKEKAKEIKSQLLKSDGFNIKIM